DDALYAHAARLTQGAARLRARDFDDVPRLLAALDAGGGGGPGGSLDNVAAWEAAGLPVDRIDLAGLQESRSAPAVDIAEPGLVPVAERYPRPNALRREVRTMLFADVVGYSRLSEEHTPAFLLGFLGKVAELVDGWQPGPELV